MNDKLSTCEKNFVMKCLSNQKVSFFSMDEKIFTASREFNFNIFYSDSTDVSLMSFVNCPFILEANGGAWLHHWAKPKCWPK